MEDSKRNEARAFSLEAYELVKDLPDEMMEATIVARIALITIESDEPDVHKTDAASISVFHDMCNLNPSFEIGRMYRVYKEILEKK